MLTRSPGLEVGLGLGGEIVAVAVGETLAEGPTVAVAVAVDVAVAVAVTDAVALAVAVAVGVGVAGGVGVGGCETKYVTSSENWLSKPAVLNAFNAKYTVPSGKFETVCAVEFPASTLWV